MREREGLLRKARQAETAARVKQWVTSPGLQPPSQRRLSMRIADPRTTHPGAPVSASLDAINKADPAMPRLMIEPLAQN
jgi:hypothetical protein